MVKHPSLPFAVWITWPFDPLKGTKTGFLGPNGTKTHDDSKIVRFASVADATDAIEHFGFLNCTHTPPSYAKKPNAYVICSPHSPRA